MKFKSQKPQKQTKDARLWNSLNEETRIRSPYVAWAILIAGCSSCLYIAFWLLSWLENLIAPFSLGPGKLLLFLLMSIVTLTPVISLFMRMRANAARLLLEDEKGFFRPFVLYLRAFTRDRGVSGVLEGSFARSCKSIGVPIAIGRPNERLPPHGFARLYFLDEDWRQAVPQMASAANALVMVFDPTDGLTWELNQVILNNWLKKTILFVPAADHDRCRHILRNKYNITVPSIKEYYIDIGEMELNDLCPTIFEQDALLGSAIKLRRYTIPSVSRIVKMGAAVSPRLEKMARMLFALNTVPDYELALKVAMTRMSPK